MIRARSRRCSITFSWPDVGAPRSLSSSFTKILQPAPRQMPSNTTARQGPPSKSGRARQSGGPLLPPSATHSGRAQYSLFKGEIGDADRCPARRSPSRAQKVPPTARATVFYLITHDGPVCSIGPSHHRYKLARPVIASDNNHHKTQRIKTPYKQLSRACGNSPLQPCAQLSLPVGV